MTDLDFERLAQSHTGGGHAPASVKARLYTHLIHAQQLEGPLATVTASKAEGRALCVFEELVQITPVGANVKSKFYCDVCHARVLAEHMDQPPIWWPNCPYAAFKNS
jgi:hypothetical protein